MASSPILVSDEIQEFKELLDLVLYVTEYNRKGTFVAYIEKTKIFQFPSLFRIAQCLDLL